MTDLDIQSFHDSSLNADAFLQQAESQQLALHIASYAKEMHVSLENFVEFDSLAIPDSARITQMSFSKHRAMVFDFGYKDSEQELHIVPIVVKRIDEEEFEKEHAAYTRLQTAGKNIPQLQVAFTLNVGDEHYLATVAEPNMMPLSELLRATFRESRDPEKLLAAYRQYASQATLSLLRLHRVGILHDDWQPKNIGIDTTDGTERAYDFERSTVTESGDQPIAETKSIEEIQHMLESCAFFATEGYFPDDLVDEKSKSPETYRKKQQKRLEELGLHDRDFTDVTAQVTQSIRQFYRELPSSSVGWTQELEEITQRIIFTRQ